MTDKQKSEGNISMHKKGALLEYFIEAVRADLRGDYDRRQRAVETAMSKSLTQDDIFMVDSLDGFKFRQIFGEKALPEDLQERMRDQDAYAEFMGYPAKYRGFYPE